MPVEILARFTSATYVARIKGQKLTASCTISAREAAAALARKLGLDPALLQEQQNDLISPNKVVVVFSHPGAPIQQTNNSGRAHCPHCGICHTSEESCNEARERCEGAGA